MFEVSLADALGPLLVVMSSTAVGFAALWLLLRDPRRAAVVASAVVLLVMLFGLVHELIEPTVGDLRVLLLALAVVVIIAAIWLALRAGPRLATVTMGLNVISLVLVVLAIVPAVQGAAAEVSSDDDVDLGPALAITTDVRLERDIYHLVLDRYGSESALKVGLGIDNSKFVTWLRDQGFEVVDDAYANYTKTMLSLASTLGMELLDEVALDVGPDGADLSPVEALVKQSRAGAFLQAQGYDYVHLGSWFMPTRDSHIADDSEYPTAEVGFATTLYDLSVLPVLLAGSDRVVDSRRRHADAALYQFDQLDRIAQRPGRTCSGAHPPAAPAVRLPRRRHVRPGDSHLRDAAGLPQWPPAEFP